MQNIILIGMPGAGKSTIGKELANKLNFGFVDTDDLIRKAYNCELKDIISAKGLSGFKQVENDVCASVNLNNHIIATGGSVIFCNEAMQHFKEIGTILYIEQPYNVIEARLGNLSERGVVFENNQTLKDIYNERTPLYEKFANITIHSSSSNVDENIFEIINLLKNKI